MKSDSLLMGCIPFYLKRSEETNLTEMGKAAIRQADLLAVGVVYTAMV